MRRKVIRIEFLVLLFLFFSVSSHAKPTVYDCFLFFNELDLLEIRLHELDPVVDKFVLVESVETHSGKSKPLYYLENKERFSKFQNKIIHVVVEDRQDTTDPWVRENYQRNQIMRGLKGCDCDDIVMISDLDEIPAARHFEYFSHPIISNQIAMASLVQTHYNFFLNRPLGTNWIGTTVAKYSFVKLMSPQFLRDNRGNLIQNGGITSFLAGGWHFSWLGDVDRYFTKLDAFAHQESNNGTITTDLIQKQMASGECEMVGNSYPKYIQENKEHYKKIGLIKASAYENLVLLPYNPHGWFNTSNKKKLNELFHCKKIWHVIEVGSWLGESTRYLANKVQKGGKVYAVDTWDGSIEHLNDPNYSGLLGSLYQQFLSNTVHAGLKDVIVPVRGQSLEVAEFFWIKADLIYIDASHDYWSVYQDIIAWHKHLKPGGIMCGDDWWLDSVRNAVIDAAEALGKTVYSYGVFWWYE